MLFIRFPLWQTHRIRKPFTLSLENGEWSCKLGEYFGQKKIDAELQFSSMEKMNAFMKGDMSKLPKMKIKSFSKL